MLPLPEVPLLVHEPAGPIRRVRLIGDADAVAWVARCLEGSGFLTEGGEPPDGRHRSSPVVWVTRPECPAAEDAPVTVAEAAAWSVPCLVVVQPGGEVPDPLAGHLSIESFDVVREPEDAALVKMRIERLLLLHSRRSQTEVVLHNLRDVVLTRRLDGTLTSVNAAGERLLGRTREQLVGRPLDELAPALSNSSVEAVRSRITLVDAAGRRRLFDRETLLLRDGHGERCGSQEILSDVTDEVESRERLEREAERKEVLASIALAARDSLDLDEVLGASAALIGTRLGAYSAQIWLLTDDRAACRIRYQWRSNDSIPSLVGFERRLDESPSFAAMITDRTPYIVEDVSTLPPDSIAAGTLRKLGAASVLGVPIHRGGETIGVLSTSWGRPRTYTADQIAFFERVSDQLALAIRAAQLYGNLQKQLAALDLAYRRRDEADRDRRRLTAMLVHDLKNPLAAVTAVLELTLEKTREGGDERLGKLLASSLLSARGLTGLIEDVLLVYRPEDAPEPQKTSVFPQDALAVPLEEARWLAARRRIQLDVDVPADLHPVRVDLPRFRRALANLLGNAVKFTPPDGVVGLTAGFRDASPGREFVVEISDTGPGVPKALRDQLAQPYVRLPGTESVPGTGLGLTVVQRVAQAHRGRLEIGERAGGGSVFSLVLPAA